MPLAMITEEQIKRCAPKAKPEYIQALIGGELYLREAGVLDSNLTLSHFMAQIFAETNGLVVLRESMTYLSVSRIRAVWPARMRKYSDAWIQANLVRQPRTLANLVYGGRMGNAKPPSDDGYDHIGGGFMQTTGKYAVEKYCRKLNIPYHPDILNDCGVTLRFACFEWKESGCGPYAQRNDLLSVSKIINVGSAKSGVMPNGMSNRKAAFAKAWGIWGDQRKIGETSAITAYDLRTQGSQTIAMADMIKAGSVAGTSLSALVGLANGSGIVAAPPPPTLDEAVETLRRVSESSDAVGTAILSVKNLLSLLSSGLWVLGIALGVFGVVYAVGIIKRRVDDARMGKNPSAGEVALHGNSVRDSDVSADADDVGGADGRRALS